MSETFHKLLIEIGWYSADRRGLGTTNDAVEFYEFVVKRIKTDIRASKASKAEEWLQRIELNGNSNFVHKYNVRKYYC